MTVETLRKNIERAMRGDDLNEYQSRCESAFEAIVEYLEDKEKEAKESRQ